MLPAPHPGEGIVAEHPTLQLTDSLADIAAAVKDITTWDRHRIHLTQHLVNTGRSMDPGMCEFRGWWRRSDLLLQAELLLVVLARHEDAVRALDPALRR